MRNIKKAKLFKPLNLIKVKLIFLKMASTKIIKKIAKIIQKLH